MCSPVLCCVLMKNGVEQTIRQAASDWNICLRHKNVPFFAEAALRTVGLQTFAVPFREVYALHQLQIAQIQIVQGVISAIMKAVGFGTAQKTVLPQEIVAEKN